MTRESDLRHRISVIALLVGMALLWPLPLGAAVLMVTATFALVISWEEELDIARPPTCPIPLDPPALKKETQ
ncbi:MAG: hypothetical protein LC721_09970 [Actinobacteria bacterium]|nr:hypothetical protein [Actinomycetota bacterium]